MPSFQTTRDVAHTPDQMFDLVADVERYPEFLPLCTGLTVLRRQTDENGVETLVARMGVGYKSISESFTSRVTLDRTHMKIVVEYVDGPFRQLTNRWTFKESPKGCLVAFFITYEFRSRMLSMLMGSVFDKAFRRFAEAFERRAGEVFGPAAA
ncbi:type II toxin-antitoxin system RatA family toxin [Chelatococcus reniformis]|uniref:Ubiquinone-binding protein n=1 Tax=Chelatococcus reniformis TaxID=1494448 RepID=A0A916U251_9HYPH|nr:type II toxin-antitoxin system RatA family toxin [Chelatococcus reniformis]GGC55737.1 ubiquinone-binding protein [Chelatococcus reniformis]